MTSNKLEKLLHLVG